MRSLLILSLACMFMSAHAGVSIESLKFSKSSTQGVLDINFTGRINDYPDLKIQGKSIQVEIPNSKVKKNIEKSVSFSSTLRDTQLRAYQTTKTKAKIKALLPFNIEKYKDKVALIIKDKTIKLTFPRKKVALKKAPEYGTILKSKKSAKKENLDESYLNELLKIDKKPENKNTESSTVVDKKSKSAQAASDKVATKMSATKKVKRANSISLIEYGGKFVAFLGLMLLMLFGLITMMKKGFIKKGKLSFLNSTDNISVISQTYIAPKKSLMLVRAHNQVFLVSNTDSGIQPISEIRDAAGLLKGEEKSVSGHNFDNNLDMASVSDGVESKVKIKEDITVSNKESALSSYLDVKDKVKFTDQLKKKAKSLKPLQ